MPKPPVLFNRLGSATEVGTSVIGDNGTVNGAVTYPAGKFGNALSVAVDNVANNVQFPFANLPDWTAPGCWEWWVRTPILPASRNYCVMFLSQTASDAGMNIYFINGRSDIRILITNQAGDDLVSNVFIPGNLTTHTWYHMAMVWDWDNKFDGTNYFVFYRDNVNVYGKDTTGNHNNNFANDLTVCNAPVSASLGDDGAVDNLKMYDYTKIDFNDRENERGGLNDQALII
jgi:hypothetical protein